MSPLFILPLFFLLSNVAAGFKVDIKGTVSCQDKPWAEAGVKLMEADHGEDKPLIGNDYIDPDEKGKCRTGKCDTDEDGHFEVGGGIDVDDSPTPGIEPYIRIDHTCGADEGCWFLDRVFIEGGNNGTSTFYKPLILDNHQIKLDEEPNKKIGGSREKKCNGTMPKGRFGNGQVEQITTGEVEQQKSSGDDVNGKMTTKDNGGDGDKNGMWKNNGDAHWFGTVAALLLIVII